MSIEQSIIEQNPSIFIPYVYDTTTPQFVRDFFQDTKKYGRVDFISPRWVKEETRTYIMMRVYFRSWNASEEALAFKKSILGGEKVRIVWGEDKRTNKELFWMVQLNNATEEQKEADRKRYATYLESKRKFRTDKRRDERSPSPRREVRRDERRGRDERRPDERKYVRGRTPPRERSPVRRDERRRERTPPRHSRYVSRSPSRARSETPPPKCVPNVIHYMDNCECEPKSGAPSAPRRERKVSRSPARSDRVAELERQLERQAEMITKLTAMMSQMEMPNVTVRKHRKLVVPPEPVRWSDEDDKEDTLEFEDDDDEDTDAAAKTKTK